MPRSEEVSVSDSPVAWERIEGHWYPAGATRGMIQRPNFAHSAQLVVGAATGDAAPALFVLTRGDRNFYFPGKVRRSGGGDSFSWVGVVGWLLARRTGWRARGSGDGSLTSISQTPRLTLTGGSIVFAPVSLSEEDARRSAVRQACDLGLNPREAHQLDWIARPSDLALAAADARWRAGARWGTERLGRLAAMGAAGRRTADD